MKKQKQSQGKDLIIKGLFFFSGSVQKRRLQSEPCYAFNETGNTFSLLLSFIPSPSPLFTARLLGQVIRGGREGTSHWKGMVTVWKPVGNQIKSLGQAAIQGFYFKDFQKTFYFTFFSRGRRGVFYERWPYSLTCCGL